jgi:hypothetical protein
MHGALSTPEFNSALLTGLNFVFDYMDYFNPRVEMLYVLGIDSRK